MSLYEYDLYLIREFDLGSLLDEIIEAGLLQPSDDESGNILGQIGCFFHEVTNQAAPSSPLRIVKLELDNVQFETFLQSNAQKFILWLQLLFKQHNIAYAFIGGGSYAAYYDEAGITSETVFKQVGHLIEKGIVEIVHPMMFYAERLGQGKVCATAKGAPYNVYEIPGVGCLLLLISGNIHSNQIEILDPGNIYPKLRHYFQEKVIDLH